MTAPAIGDGGPAPVTVAAFDFDGTLTSGGSVVPFLVRMRGVPAVAGAVLRTFLPLLRGALMGGSAADRSKETLFGHLLSGVAANDVDKVSVEFAEDHVRQRVRRDVRDRLDWHLAQGHRVVVVSASPENYVRPASELLGAHGVLATRLAVGGGGLLTGRYEGKNCRGIEKYTRLVGWLRAEGLAGAGLPQPILWAYGNSRGDLRLLEAADYGVDAGRLGRWGRLGRFPRLSSLTAPPARRRT